MKKILLTACLFSFFIAVPFSQALLPVMENTSVAMVEVDTIIRTAAILAVTAEEVTMISAATIPEATAEADTTLLTEIISVATAEAAITISMATI